MKRNINQTTLNGIMTDIVVKMLLFIIGSYCQIDEDMLSLISEMLTLVVNDIPNLKS